MQMNASPLAERAVSKCAHVCLRAHKLIAHLPPPPRNACLKEQAAGTT